MIDEYVTVLGRELHGPDHIKRDLLTEVRHGLADAAEGYRADGLPAGRAEARAVAEFGPAQRLAADFQAELAASTVRTLSVRVAVVTALLVSSADLMWRGAPWSGPRPPEAYHLLSTSIDWLGGGCAALALASLVWLTAAARRGRAGSVRVVRLTSYSMIGSLALYWLGGLVLYGWSLHLWKAALTWPPMIIGMLVLTAAYGWIAAAARSCLVAAR
jgi:hypothetical protein